jgi:hypothetical protein
LFCRNIRETLASKGLMLLEWLKKILKKSLLVLICYDLNRVGISSYVLDEQDSAEKAIAVMSDFSDTYQESVA